MKKIALLICALCLVVILPSRAQLTGGRYKIQYNASTCRYDIFLVPGGGTFVATDTLKRLTRTSRLSVVVPSGSSIDFQYPNQPRFRNTAGTASAWQNNGVSDNFTIGTTAYEVYPFDVNVTNTWYSAISNTNPILLFSLDITLPAGNVCGAGVRLWRNNVIQGVGQGGASSSTGCGGSSALVDPCSAAMPALANYNNSFKIGDNSVGGLTEKYTGISGTNVVTLPPPTITPFTLGISGGNITTSSAIASGSCATLQSYTWTGPNAYSATTNTVASSATASLSRAVSAANLGTYTLSVTNSNGCTASASNVIALPIKLLSFSGSANKCAAQLSWQIVHGEKDFQGFDVQYSGDGARFGTVGHLDRSAYNDSYGYSYIQASGKGFYRLQITDLSGKVTYSETVVVTTDCDNPEITIAPNPTQALSTVSGIEAGDQVKVTDMLGNVIANYISGGSRATIDLGIFPSGVYSVMISRGTDMLKTAKITKL